MSTIEVIGSPLNSIVLDQLKLRAEYLSTNTKNVETIIVSNSNTGWVRVRSGVNVITESEAKSWKDNGNQVIPSGDSTIAKNYILSGGTRSVGGQGRAGISLEKGAISATAAYNNSEKMGFRPMPGITGLTVRSKNTYGTIMEATVDFVVWTLEDLNNCEILYFRPGYTALIEWGHSVYMDEGGLNRQAYIPSSGKISEFGFYENQEGISTIEKELLDSKLLSRGNYEGMVGYIVNFSWSFRKDGGYNCSIKVLSKGSILENLAIPVEKEVIKENQGKTGKTAGLIGRILNVFKRDAPEEAETGKESRRSVLHKAFKNLKESVPGESGSYSSTPIAWKEGTGNKRGSIHFWKLKFPKSRNETEGTLYIQLRGLLILLNKFISPHSKSENLLTFNTEWGHKYRTFPGHFSANPLVALPQGVPSCPNIGGKDIINKSFHLRNLHTSMGNKSNGGLNEILGIIVNVDFVLSEIDKVINTSEEDNLGLLDALKGILYGIELALGGVNNLELYYDYGIGTYSIVDYNKINRNGVGQIDVYGLKSSVFDISISSKISNQIASMVAIAAQGTAKNYSKNVETLLTWNRRAVDRFAQIKEQGYDETGTEAKVSNAEESGEISPLEDLEKAWNSLTTGMTEVTGKNTKEYQKETGDYFELFQNLQREASFIIRTLADYDNIQNNSEPAGVVPVELTLKMLGISGVKVGQAFTVKPGLLPNIYDSFGYIVTGVEHSIEGGKWVTSLKTQFYYVKSKFSDKTKPSSIQKSEMKTEVIPSEISEITVKPSSVNDNTAFLNAMGKRESGGRYDAVNSLGYMGKYQFGQDTLNTLGYSVTKEEFISSPDLQEEAMMKNLKRNKKILQKYIDQYDGKYHNGVYMTESGMLAAAHLGGPGSVISFCKSGYNPSDAYGTSIVKYMEEFSGFNLAL